MYEYKILTSNDINGLEIDVNSHINKGYELAGGITKDYGVYLQAVIKKPNVGL